MQACFSWVRVDILTSWSSAGFKCHCASLHTQCTLLSVGFPSSRGGIDDSRWLPNRAAFKLTSSILPFLRSFHCNCPTSFSWGLLASDSLNLREAWPQNWSTAVTNRRKPPDELNKAGSPSGFSRPQSFPVPRAHVPSLFSLCCCLTCWFTPPPSSLPALHLWLVRSQDKEDRWKEQEEMCSLLCAFFSHWDTFFNLHSWLNSWFNYFTKHM